MDKNTPFLIVFFMILPTSFQETYNNNRKILGVSQKNLGKSIKKVIIAFINPRSALTK